MTPPACRSPYFAAERFRLRDQLLLHGGIREPLPLVHLAQLVELRRDRAPAPPSAVRRAPCCSRSATARRRVDRGAQLAGDAVGFAQREVFGRRARLWRARSAVRCAAPAAASRRSAAARALLGALPDACVGGGESLGDRRVEVRPLAGTATAHSRCTASHASAASVVLRRRAARASATARRAARWCARVSRRFSMPLGGAPAGLLEARAQSRSSSASCVDGPGKPSHSDRAFFDLVERVLAARVLSSRSQSAARAGGAPRRPLGGAPLGFRALVRWRSRPVPLPRARRSARPSPDRARTCRRSDTSRATPLRRRRAARPRSASRGRRRCASTRARMPATRCCHCFERRLRAASASSIACTIARARFATALFFARVGQRLRACRARRPSAARPRRPLERGNAGVLVIGLERDVEELRRIGDARHRVERGLRIGGMPRDAARAP